MSLDIPSDAQHRLARWFARRLDDPELAIDVTPLAGGLVNANYVVDISGPSAGAHRFVLRVDPIQGPQAPYDMPRQFNLCQALAKTQTPIPAPLWLETDPAILGRDFWVSQFVEGESVGRMIDYADPLAEPRMQAFVAMLIKIHGADWRAAGLDRYVPVVEPAKIKDLIEAETPFLQGVPSKEDRALFEGARSFLHAHAPKRFELSMTHGDCSLANYLFRGTEIVAVLDWDLALITDRVRDVAFYLSLIFRFNSGGSPAENEKERRQFIERFEPAGVAMENLLFWETYANYHNALSWTRPGWSGSTNGYEPYKVRLATLLA